MGQRMPVAAPSNPVEIYSYINDMVTELAIMATRAGHLELARRLGEAIKQPRLFPWPEINKSQPDLRL
jgi:hypothetical protein